MKTESIFPTIIGRGSIPGHGALNRKLLVDIKDFSRRDKVGKEWSRKNYVGGYTSYASLPDLHLRSPSFDQFSDLMQPHAEAFAKAQGWEMKGIDLQMTDCWMNIMPKHTLHSLHMHPHSVISGTYYVSIPKGSSSFRIEDPRVNFYMNAPHKIAPSLFYEAVPKEGAFILFESWLRHEVPMNQSNDPRISLSFNYALSPQIDD